MGTAQPRRCDQLVTIGERMTNGIATDAIRTRLHAAFCTGTLLTRNRRSATPTARANTKALRAASIIVAVMLCLLPASLPLLPSASNAPARRGLLPSNPTGPPTALPPILRRTSLRCVVRRGRPPFAATRLDDK